MTSFIVIFQPTVSIREEDFNFCFSQKATSRLNSPRSAKRDIISVLIGRDVDLECAFGVERWIAAWTWAESERRVNAKHRGKDVAQNKDVLSYYSIHATLERETKDNVKLPVDASLSETHVLSSANI